jgi:hypothetical protein
MMLFCFLEDGRKDAEGPLANRSVHERHRGCHLRPFELRWKKRGVARTRCNVATPSAIDVKVGSNMYYGSVDKLMRKIETFGRKKAEDDRRPMSSLKTHCPSIWWAGGRL